MIFIAVENPSCSAGCGGDGLSRLVIVDNTPQVLLLAMVRNSCGWRYIGVVAAGAILWLGFIGATISSSNPIDSTRETIRMLQACSAFGAGFFAVPGSDTCIRIGGRIRIDVRYFASFDHGNSFSLAPGFGNGFDDDAYGIRVRNYSRQDTRTSTGLGPLRTYSELRLTQDNNEDVAVRVERAFIQLNGLLIGTNESYYDYDDVKFTPLEFFDAAISDENPQLMAAYTHQLPYGGSVTIAAEDNTGRRDGLADFFNPHVGGMKIQTTSEYGGAQIPDIVGQLRFAGDWGSVQLMAASHYVNAVTRGSGAVGNGTDIAVRRTSDAYGFVVGGGSRVNLPFGENTAIGGVASFARGAANFASTSISAPNNLATDGVVGVDGALRLTDYFTFSGGGETALAPDILLGFQMGLLLASPQLGGADIDGDDRPDDGDFINLDLQAFLSWYPVSNLLFGLGAEYRYANVDAFGDGQMFVSYMRAQIDF